MERLSKNTGGKLKRFLFLFAAESSMRFVISNGRKGETLGSHYEHDVERRFSAGEAIV